MLNDILLTNDIIYYYYLANSATWNHSECEVIICKSCSALLSKRKCKCTHIRPRNSVSRMFIIPQRERRWELCLSVLLVPLLTGSIDFLLGSGMRFATGHLFDGLSECSWFGLYVFIHANMLLMVWLHYPWRN